MAHRRGLLGPTTLPCSVWEVGVWAARGSGASGMMGVHPAVLGWRGGVNPPFYYTVVSGPCRLLGPAVPGPPPRVRMLGCAFVWSRLLPLGGRGHERPPRSVLRCRGGQAGHRVPRVGLHVVGRSQGEILAEELSRRGGLDLICP